MDTTVKGPPLFPLTFILVSEGEFIVYSVSIGPESCFANAGECDASSHLSWY